MCDAPAYGLLTTLSNSIKDRNRLIALSRIFGNIAAAAATGFLPALRNSIGSWFASAIWFSLIALVMMLPIAIVGREVRVVQKKKKEKVSIKQILYYISHNKYMIVFYLGTLIMQGLAINGVLNAYFARYCLKNEELLGVLMPINIVPLVVLGMFMPAVLDKIDKYYIFYASIIGLAAISAIQYFAGYENWTLFLIIWSIKAILLAINNLLIYAFTPDFAEYGTYKTKIPATGITFTLQTFTSKVNGALGSALGIFLLSVIHFTEGKDSVQVDSFSGNLWFLFTIIPAIGYLVVLPIFWQYKLREKDVEKIIAINVKNAAEQGS
jgi:Na+/melibiose symporter-like transporter